MSWDRKLRDNKKHHDTEVEFDDRRVNKKPKKIYIEEEYDSELEELSKKFSNFDFGIK
ncbi:MAG: hypothetical protein PHC28_15830 [Flavobacterium sp.]|uniref:hypothetical protein n=1 Tax=Flavobacterium sp. TaxID=239 RepID=UPI00262DD405|nr:hypothetical protein [Flavobacterium sp.]MDD5151923.1 hypothetical protein [Flavobacterium sp.]